MSPIQVYRGLIEDLLYNQFKNQFPNASMTEPDTIVVRRFRGEHGNRYQVSFKTEVCFSEAEE